MELGATPEITVLSPSTLRFGHSRGGVCTVSIRGFFREWERPLGW